MPPTQSNRLPYTQLFLATILVVFSAVVVGTWLLLVLAALQHALDPWVNAGILLFGLGFVGFAAVPGVPGVLWSRSLARRFSGKWAWSAKLPALVGTVTLVLGLLIALAVLVFAR